jgi:hypothetical protein
MKSEAEDSIKMEMKAQRNDCGVEMNHRESCGKGMGAPDSINTEIKTEPMDEGNATSENSATIKGEFLQTGHKISKSYRKVFGMLSVTPV